MVNQVLWITLDSAALALWGCYGNLQGWTLYLDAFAAQGVVFDEYHATRASGDPNRENRKWEELLSSAGGVFEQISLLTEDSRPISRNDRAQWKELKQKLVQAFQAVRNKHKPAFICAALPKLTGESSDAEEEHELLEEESPPPRGFPYQLLSEEERTGAIQDLVFLDEWLGKIHDLWDEAASDEVNSWFIITAARGECFPFAETEDHPGPAELLTHVPLLVLNRAGALAGERCRELAGERDLEQAVRRLLTQEETGMSSWQKFLQGETTEAMKSLLWRDAQGEAVLRTADGLLITGEQARLFHLPEDRWGLRDVSHSEQELFERLQAELQEKLTKDQTAT